MWCISLSTPEYPHFQEEHIGSGRIPNNNNIYRPDTSQILPGLYNDSANACGCWGCYATAVSEPGEFKNTIKNVLGKAHVKNFCLFGRKS
jgi:hypothetical protein